MKFILKKALQPMIILRAIFLILIMVEMYLLYLKVYKSMDTEVDAYQNSSVVRLDLANYNKTLELLDAFKNYKPQNAFNTNPFK